MKTFFRWTIRVIVGLLLALVAVIVLREPLLRWMAERQLRRQTGLETKIGKFDVGIFSPMITIRDLKIYNSAAFGGKPLLDLAELHVEYDADALRALKLRLKLVRFNLAEVNVVTDTNGRNNLQELQDKAQQAAPGGATNQLALGVEFDKIDTLDLTLGMLRYTDMKQPDRPQEVDLGLKHEVIHNVKSANDINQALVNVMLRRGIGLLGGGSPFGGAAQGGAGALNPLTLWKQLSPPAKN